MRVDIKLPEAAAEKMKKEQYFSGMTKRTISLIAVTEYLNKKEKERKK